MTDSKVVEFFYQYQGVSDIDAIRKLAEKDFWDHFEESRNDHGLQTWAAYHQSDPQTLLGWSALLHTELTEQYGGPELQFMLASAAHGKGYATEIAAAVVQDGLTSHPGLQIIATVDIPNTGSISVLEKLGLKREGQIHAYGSDDMYLYRLPSTL